jgi:hypothetical protein
LKGGTGTGSGMGMQAGRGFDDRGEIASIMRFVWCTPSCAWSVAAAEAA